MPLAWVGKGLAAALPKEAEGKLLGGLQEFSLFLKEIAGRDVWSFDIVV